MTRDVEGADAAVARPCALITGGSSGLGLALAEQLAERGHDLHLLARDPDKLDRAEAMLRARFPGVEIAVHACDVSDPGSLERAFAEVRRRRSALDFVAVNAGAASIDLLQDYPDAATIAGNLNVNLVGAVNTAYFATGLLRPGSRLLFVSSGFAYVGPAGYSLYAAAKAGMNNFAEAMRRELLHRRVRVHLACPGDIDTPMYRGELEIMPDWMRAKSGRGKARPASEVARAILGACFRNRFLIVPSTDVRLVLLMQRLLPRSWAMWVADRLLPMP